MDDLENLKENKINPQTELDENIKLDTFIEMHFNQLPDTNWKTTKSKHYSNYLQKSLGSKKVTDIKQMHIKECIKAQQDLGLSARTAKTTIEILNPLFKEAIANRLITFNPCDGVRVKLPKTKKTVLHASNELSMILRTINDIFKDDPYYLSFYKSFYSIKSILWIFSISSAACFEPSIYPSVKYFESVFVLL